MHGYKSVVNCTFVRFRIHTVFKGVSYPIMWCDGQSVGYMVVLSATVFSGQITCFWYKLYWMCNIL